MQLSISGHHIDVTDALKSYVTEKLQKLERHFDHITTAHVVLSVEKLRQRAEATIHISGADNSTGRLIAMQAFMRDHRSAFEAFDVSAGEAALTQGDSFEEGGILNDYTLASMVFGPECGDMRIRFWDDAAAGFRHHRIPCLAG